jgi:hypothetical protein
LNIFCAAVATAQAGQQVLLTHALLYKSNHNVLGGPLTIYDWIYTTTRSTVYHKMMGCMGLLFRAVHYLPIVSAAVPIFGGT